MTGIVRRRAATLGALALASLTSFGGGGTTASNAAAAASVPQLVAVRASHSAGRDRVVFDFAGTIPAHRSVTYVKRLIADPKGTAMPLAGRAILAVRFDQAAAHTDTGQLSAPTRVVFSLPNVIAVVRSGDFEGVLSYGIALARQTGFRVFSLGHPSRVVIDISTRFRTAPMRVYFFNDRRFAANTPPFVSAVTRPVSTAAPATGLMDRLFAGPTLRERSSGLRLLASRATGFTNLSVAAGIARIRLTGGCSSGGSTATLADEIAATLKQLPAVHWVKVYDPAGHTEEPFGQRDSIPTCLEP